METVQVVSGHPWLALFVTAVVFFLAGWWARKYAEKKDPVRVANADAAAKELGDRIEAKVDALRQEFRERTDKL